ncbi:MAG: oxidoreductase [Bacillota bacterium]
MRTALVLGATGLIGGHLVRQLLDRTEYGRVVLLLRRPLDLAHPKLEQRVVDLDRMAEHRQAFQVDDLYCCLGTTMRKAGSREAFRRVDFDYPLAAARLAREAGVKRFLLVTSMGADARSSVFYSRVKGEVEEAIEGVGLPSLLIFRPSLLLGEREEVRFGESVAAVISRVIGPLMVGPLARVRAIEGKTVALAMIRAALEGPAGVRRYQSDEIGRLGE